MSLVRVGLGAAAVALVLAGCSGLSDDGEPLRLNGNHPKVAALIEVRYADCLVALDAGPVKFSGTNLYYAVASAGPLSWSVMSAKNEILTPPTQWAVATLRTVGC